jgi:hypothetical protein
VSAGISKAVGGGRARATRASLAVLAATAALLAPRAALACAVCFSGAENSRIAFLVTTIFMTALPLVLVGGFAWWLRRRSLALERAARPSASPSRAG